MDEIINQIDELKKKQQFPRYYLSKYFDDLKAQVDLKYALNLDENEKYLEIIRHIESFEQNAYNIWNNRRINAYHDEIDSIKEKLNNNFNLDDINKLIDQTKYKIEKMMFSNKSILFFDNKKSNCSFASNSFLLIINDEYISKSCIDNDSSNQNLLTRNEFNFFYLKQKLKSINLNSSCVINLDIEIINLEVIYFSVSVKHIKEIDSNLFNGLVNLESIYFINNQIKELQPNLFNELVNLKQINFSNNQIKELHLNTFNGLSNLNAIWFAHNQIEEIHPNLFNDLHELHVIDLSYNKIKEIKPNTFSGLVNLRNINFSNNRIGELHPNLLTGLAHLMLIDFRNNSILPILPIKYFLVAIFVVIAIAIAIASIQYAYNIVLY